MNLVIYCSVTKRGIHSFYLVVDGKKYWLFSQKYRKGVQKYYRKGVTINQAIDYSKAHKNTAIEKTMSKIPIHIKYVEKEYGIQVLEKTKRKKKNRKNILTKCA